MIVSRQNQRIKEIRRLRAGKHPDRALLEGPHLLKEALASGLALETVLMTPEFEGSPKGERLSRQLSETPLEVSPAIMNELCDADSPRGVLAVASLPRPGAEALTGAAAPGLYVEGVQDPGNVGALARSAEAAGTQALVLSPGCAHPNHPRTLRASAGSLLRLPTFVGVEFRQARASLAGAEFLALVARGGVDLYELEPRAPAWLVVGAEGAGLSDDTVAACDHAVTIPLASTVESLNTAAAASVALFELRRTRT